MINGHLILSIEDTKKFKEVKKSPIYSDYLHTVIKSPLMNEIIQEHIEDLDVIEEIRKLKTMNASEKDFANIFKDSLSKIAKRIVADTIIMKELTELSIEEVKSELLDNFKIKYILGLAEKTYYDKAKLILKNKPDTESILYQGLIEFNKKNKKVNNNTDIDKIIPDKKVKSIIKPIINKEINVTFTSTDKLDI